MLPLIWFCSIAAMLVVYVLLDRFDLGAGAVHLFIANTDAERTSVFKSIGPVWDGSEVWLLAAGGTLYCVFPAVYAASFSGLYLPLMMVLWLLILRGISIEFRSHIDSPLWKPLWDVVFALSSSLLCVFLGAALANVVRGVPLDAQGEFFLPLWTDFRPGPAPGVLDWYTVLTGVLALASLALHGSTWVAYKTSADVNLRARRAGKWLCPVVMFLTVLTTWASLLLQPQILLNLTLHPWGSVFPIIALSGLAMAAWAKHELARFLGSSGYLAGMLASAAFGLFPYVLPASAGASNGLTIHNAATAGYGLRVGLAWWIPGMALALAYSVFVYRKSAGKVV